MTIKPLELIERVTLLDAGIFTAHKDRMKSGKDGHQFDFFVMEVPDWVNVIARTDDDQVVLIRQYRHGIAGVTSEIPGGMVDPGETPLQAAQRELSEETGFSARDWEEIGAVEPNPAIQSNTTYTFLATGAIKTGEQHMDENEDIEVFQRPLEDIPAMLNSGEIKHALVFCAFAHLAQKKGFDLFQG